MRRRTALVVAAVVVLAGPAWTQQDAASGEFSQGFGTDDGDGFSDGFGDGFDAGTAEGGESDPAGFGAFGGAPTVEWSGRLRFDVRGYMDYDEPEQSPLEAAARARLDLSAEGRSSEAFVRLQLRDGLTLEDAGDELARSLVDEAWFRLFFDRATLTTGYLKTVWGTGDEVYTLDPLNSNDFSDFINPDYIERRLAAGMIKLDVPLGAGTGLFELAYLPLLRPDLIPEEGPWVPAELTILDELVAGYAELVAAQLVAGTTDPAVAARTASALAAETVRFEDTGTLDFAQIGARVSGAVGRFDLGAQYYWGYLKTPTPRFRLADPTDPRAELVYERIHATALEAAAVFGPFNTRAELAYTATEDSDGDDPEVPNHSVAWLAGFDVDLGVSSLNLNAQALGTVLLNPDSIDEDGPIAGLTTLPTPGVNPLLTDAGARYNFQYDEDGEYTETIVTVVLTDAWRNERARPEVAVSVVAEKLDWRVSPSLAVDLRDDATLTLEAAVFGGDEDSLFGRYDAADYVRIRFEYSF